MDSQNIICAKEKIKYQGKTKDKKQRDEKVCQLYKQNMLVGEIAKILEIDRHTVTRILKKYKVYDANKNQLRLNADKIYRNEEIIKLYQSGKSFRKIATLFNIGHTTVEQIVNNFVKKDIVQYNIKIDDKDNLIRHRKYSFNYDFFKTIDTEEKAYWLGFLYADGCITENEVRLELKLNDEDHLNKMKKSLNGEAIPIFHRKDIKSSLVVFSSLDMVNDLKRLGCIQRKTFELDFPTYSQVPKKLLHHFMRGYFDGDGCIYLSKKISGTNLFTVIGCKKFITKYKEVLCESISKENTNKLHIPQNCNKGIASFFLGGNIQIYKIYKFLYKDATIFLDRKKEKFEKIIGRLKPNKLLEA